MLEDFAHSIWAAAAAVISALGGYYMYDRKRIDDRMNRVERELQEHKTDLAVVREQVSNIREDTQEIKMAQKVMLDLLTMKR